MRLRCYGGGPTLPGTPQSTLSGLSTVSEKTPLVVLSSLQDRVSAPVLLHSLSVHLVLVTPNYPTCPYTFY